MRSKLATHLLSCALVAPAVLAGTYTAGLAVIVTDVHLLERAMLERAPSQVRETAHAMYGDFVHVYGPFFSRCWTF